MTQVSLAQFPNAQLPSEFGIFLATWQGLLGTQDKPLSNNDFAARIDVPWSTLREYMLGHSHPRKARVLELEKKAGFKLEQFYERPKKLGVPAVAERPVKTTKQAGVVTGRTHYGKPAESAQPGVPSDNLQAANISPVRATPVKDLNPVEAIIARRKALGLSTKQFAQSAQLHAGGWARIERGQPHANRRNYMRAACTHLDKLEKQAQNVKPTVDGRVKASQHQTEKFAEHIVKLMKGQGANVMTFHYKSFYVMLKQVTGVDTIDPTALSEYLRDRKANPRMGYLMMAGDYTVVFARDDDFAPAL